MKDDSQTRVPLEGSRRVAMPGARAIGRANPHSTLEVSVKLRRKRKLPELDGPPAKLMTRQELTDNYGASNTDIDKAVNAFGKFGLNCVSSSAATRSVRLSGTVGQMERAFAVKLFNYSHPDGDYRGRVGEISVPAEMKGIVEGVFGLDNRRVTQRKRKPATYGGGTLNGSGFPASWYTSAELAAHYHFPPGDGRHQTIGLLEFGGGYFPSDLQEFCQLVNIGMPTVKAISADGTSTSAHDGAEGEVMMDVEVVADVCPKATIAVYFAQWSELGWITCIDAAVHDHVNDPHVLSASWGLPEDINIWTPAAMHQVNQTLLEAAHLGITVCIAAGDDGSSDADLDGHAHVNFPASSPYVLAVGGTTIPHKGGTQPDVVWFEGNGLRSSGGGSTGGGVSANFHRRAWQSHININSVNPGAIVGRCIPDLAANADWNASPYLMVVDGAMQSNGGTSAASPLVASLIARINDRLGPGRRVGYLTPILYRHHGKKSGATVGSFSCTDVVSGNNDTSAAGGYSAGPGYDAASGWGTPNGVKLLEALLHP